MAPSVEAFDKLMNGMVAEFLRNSRILAGDVETHVSTFLPCSVESPQWPVRLWHMNSMTRFLLWRGRK